MTELANCWRMDFSKFEKSKNWQILNKLGEFNTAISNRDIICKRAQRTSMTKKVLIEGGFGILLVAGLAIFYPQVFGFSLKNVRVSGFHIFDGLRVLPFSELGFRDFR